MNKQVGLFNLPVQDTDHSETFNKVLRLFEKSTPAKKSKYKFGGKLDVDPHLKEQDDSPDFDKLNRDAVKSLFVLPEVIKTEEGHIVV